MELARKVPNGKYRLEQRLTKRYMLARSVQTNKWNVIDMGGGYSLFDEDLDSIQLYADTILEIKSELEVFYFDLTKLQYVCQVVAKAFHSCEKYRQTA